MPGDTSGLQRLPCLQKDGPRWERWLSEGYGSEGTGVVDLLHGESIGMSRIRESDDEEAIGKHDFYALVVIVSWWWSPLVTNW